MTRVLNSQLLTIILLFSLSAAANIKLMSWNAKHLGRKNQDLTASANLLAGADIIAIQEVNSTETGTKAATELARLLGVREGARFCIGLSEIPTDAKERYAVLWREKKISYVTTDGKEIVTCPAFAVTLRLGAKNAKKIVREPAIGTWREAGGGKFTLAIIHLVPTAKKPQNEVEPLFDTAASLPGKWLKIVLGDMNLDSGHSAFAAAITLGFKPALITGTKTSLKSKEKGFSQAYDNIWVKGPPSSIILFGVVDPFAVLPSLGVKAIYNGISDHAPIWAEMNTNAGE
jgi:endonuclease/exonuclease/phosphatase family metal-dependent hydrolase